MLKFTMIHPKATPEVLGYIPTFLSEDDPRPAKEQFHENYAHGGGWSPFKGFILNADDSISYPGDPAYPLLAQAQLRDETIRYYNYSWVMILQKDGSFEIARMD